MEGGRERIRRRKEEGGLVKSRREDEREVERE